MVRAFAAACGADPDQWSARLREAAATQPPATGIGAQPPAADHSTVVANAGRFADLAVVNGAMLEESHDRPPVVRIVAKWVGGEPPHRKLRAVITALVLLAVGCGLGVAIMIAFGAVTQKGAAQAPAHSYPAGDGEDPVAAGCTADARLIDKMVVFDGATQVGALELEYSPRCAAGWARAYLYPAGVPRLSGTLAAVTIEAGDGTSAAWTAKLSAQIPDFTDVVKPHGGCLRASVTLGARTDHPLQAAIPCDGIDADALG